MEIVFWSIVSVILYTYIIYPLLLFLIGSAAPYKTGPPDDTCLPPITILIPSYNEGQTLVNKIANIVHSDYPATKMEIIIGLDGTPLDRELVECIRRHKAYTFRLKTFPVREGKMAVISKLAPLCKSEIIVVSDADIILAPNALRLLVSHFSNPEVGAVSGTLMIEDAHRSALSRAMALYLKYEVFQRKYQNGLGSALSVHGGFYGIRRNLLADRPPLRVTDDLFASLNVLKCGYRIIYSIEAVSFGRSTSSLAKELSRKIRMAVGSFNCFRLMNELLFPRYGLVTFHLWSYMVLRHISGLLCLVILIINHFLILTAPLYLSLLLLQYAFYAFAVIGLLLGHKMLSSNPISIFSLVCAYLTIMNIGRIVGLKTFIFPERRLIWEVAR